MSNITVKDFVNAIEMFRDGLAESLKNKSMNDYIKREMAADSIVLECDNVTLEQARQAIKDVPSADVVEVVRCKDCKHKPHTKEPDGDGYGFDITADGDFTCPFLCDDGYYNRMPSDDFYCSYGERKEQEHES